MNCLSDAMLRAFTDHELDSTEQAQVQKHLSECPACQTRASAISAASLRVNQYLVSLEDSPPSPGELNPQMALSRFKASLPADAARQSIFSRIFARRFRFAWTASLAIAVLMLSLIFPSARSFAQRLLATLRIERVQTIPINFSQLDGPRDRLVQQAIGQMISDNVVVTANENSFAAKSKEEASNLVGFPVRLPATLTDAPDFSVSGAHAFHLTVDRSRLQEVLDQAGRTDLILPATLDGATVSVKVPRAVAANFGTCPHHEEPQGQAAASNCVVLFQAPSPIVDVPNDLNLQQIAETALQLTGMSATQARQFAQTIDWRTTLVLPVPTFVQSYQSVNVDGVQGTLMKTSAHRGPDPAYVLVWVKSGIIYALMTTGDSNSALQLANSLE